MPRLSVLMSVYNDDRHVAECVDSVLSQSFSDFEFIIVEDGSGDRTGEVLSRYRDSRVVVLPNRQNIGLTASLNRGLARAGGELIARIDSDDVCLPGRFMEEVRFLDENADHVAVGTGTVYIDAQGRPSRRSLKPLYHPELRFVSLFYPPLAHSTAMIRASALAERSIAYDEEFETAQDYDLWSRLGEVGKIANLPSCLVRCRSGQRRISSMRRTLQIANHKRISRRNIDRYVPGYRFREHLETVYRALLTATPLYPEDLELFCAAMFGLAEDYATATGERPSLTRRVAAEYIFNHGIRKRSATLPRWDGLAFLARPRLLAPLMARSPSLLVRRFWC